MKSLCWHEYIAYIVDMMFCYKGRGYWNERDKKADGKRKEKALDEGRYRINVTSPTNFYMVYHILLFANVWTCNSI